MKESIMAGWRRPLKILRWKIYRCRYLLCLLTSQVAILGLDFYLSAAISLQPYYWVPVVLSILFVSPRQVFLLSALAFAFTVLAGFYWGYFLSADYLSVVLSTIVVSTISVLISIRIQRSIKVQKNLEERYRLLAENASDIVIFAQPDHCIRWVSPSLQSVLDWGLEDWIGSRVASFIHSQDRFILETLYAKAIFPEENTTKHEQSIRIRHKNGDYRWFSIRVAAVKDEAGQPIGFVKGFRDIHDQVRSQQALREERAQLRAVMDSLIDPHVLLTAIWDDKGNIVDFRYTDANPAACLYNQMTREQLIGKTLLEILPAHKASGLLDHYIQTMQSFEPLILNDYAYPHDIYNEERRFDIRAVRVDNALSYTWRDVTDRYQAAQQLAESKERCQQLAQRWEFAMGAGDIAIYEADLRTQTAFYSPGLLKQLGYQEGDWSDRLDEWWQRLHPEDILLIEQNLKVNFTDQSQPNYTTEYRIQHRDGSYRWILDRGKVMSYDDEGRPLSVMGVNVDITSQKYTEQELSRQAKTDELTGLINRREAIARIQALCALDRRHGKEFAVLFCDLDCFKDVNDHFGHLAGDTVLQVVARRIKLAIRSNDFAARIGGDEFLVVLQGVHSLKNAVVIAEKLRYVVAQPISTDAGCVAQTMTIGVTLIQPAETIDTLIARADAAMYQGKQSGRDRVIPFA